MEDHPMRPFPLVAILLLSACLPNAEQAEPPSGAEDFVAYCAGCHGISGQGDGALAATLDRRPADLTGLAARNGGDFPTTRVMAKIWGYTGGQRGGAVMPNFGPLLDSDLVPYDGGDGIDTPTPARLVGIAEYLKTLQG
jgi:mono/diheme cytochrome c family protein